MEYLPIILQINMNREHLSGVLFSLIGFILLTFCLWILNQELSKYNANDIINSLLSIESRQILLAICLTTIGYLVISCYDLIAFQHFNLLLDKRKIFFTTFIVYAISNFTGFTLLIGGGIRYRFYSRWKISAKNIAKITALGNLTFWLGLLAISSITCLINTLPISHFIQLNLVAIRPFGCILITILFLYLYCCQQQKYIKIKGIKYYFPSLITSLSQILVFALDWALAAAVLYVLFPIDSNLEYVTFYSIFLLAMTTSIISNVPGGIGVFETVILLLLPKTIYTPDALNSFLAYRTIRHFLPLSLGIFFVSIFELSHKNKQIKKKQN